MAPPHRIDRFEAGPGAYEALAALMNRVLPERPTCAEFLRRLDREPEPGRRHWREIVRSRRGDGRWLGASEHGQQRQSGAAAQAELQLYVDPSRRRRGIGSALFDRAIRRLTEPPFEVIASWTSEEHPDGRRFLEARGFRLAHRHPESELDLARFDPAPLAASAERLTRSGIRLRTLAELLAADPGCLEKLYELQGEVAPDAPGAGGYELPPFESWTRAFDDNPDLLPEAHVVAVDGERYVGMTQLWASQATDTILYTGLTGVRREHRRRGVATALKLRSLSWARTLRTANGRHPVVRTDNEETNPMLALNRRLGFRERAAWLEYRMMPA